MAELPVRPFQIMDFWDWVDTTPFSEKLKELSKKIGCTSFLDSEIAIQNHTVLCDFLKDQYKEYLTGAWENWADMVD